MEAEALMQFDVHVHSRPDGGADLHAAIGDAGGQESAAVTKAAIARLPIIREQLDATDGHFADPPRFDFAWCQAQGTAVFEALFAGRIEHLYRTHLERARREARTLAIRVMYDGRPIAPGEPAAIHEAPWELAFDPREKQFLALWPETCLSRYLRMPRRERRVVRPTPAPLLLSLADAKPPLGLDEECARVRAVTQRQMDVVPLRVDGSRPLCHALANAAAKNLPFVGWHHVGHGTIDEQTREFALVFERDGEHEETALTDIVETVAQSGVHCAVLNVCYSGTSHGLAKALASANVPVVVGHRTAVDDSACISFAATFWRELSAGRPAELAMRTARVSVLARGLGTHWALPMLFVRVGDTRLVAQPR